MQLHIKTIFATIIVIALLNCALIIGIADAVYAQDDVSPNQEGMDGNDIDVELQTGTTSILGGGDYIALKSQAYEAWIAVIYGTEENANSIVLLSIFTRYLGAADVYDEHSALVSQDHPIPIMTLFGMKFEDIYEFNDTNQNGMCNVRAPKKGGAIMPGQVLEHEPVYKKVSLTTAWELSNITSTQTGENSKSWEFALTARNLPYVIAGDPEKITADGTLDELTFTFHLEAEWGKVTHRDVPVYRVEIKLNASGVEEVTRSEFIEYREYSATALTADFKIDHYISGWDYDPTNANPGLIMVVHALFGNAVGPRVAEWINLQFVRDIHAAGKVEFERADGVKETLRREELPEVPDVEAPEQQPRLVRRNRNRLNFADNWQSIGRLAWESNVTMDGVEDEMYFQVHGGHRYALEQIMFGREWKFHGLLIMGGFSYPGGETIYHDPSYIVTALSIDFRPAEFIEKLIDILPIKVVLSHMLIAILATIVVFSISVLRRRRQRRKV